MYRIEVENLTKKFGTFTAVDHISFQVGEGEIFGFLGANGAGKTTAIKMLCGLLTPTSGRATVAGFDVKTQAKFIKRNIGYMSQRFSLYNDLSIYENMQLYGTIYRIPNKLLKNKIIESLETLGMATHAQKLVGDLPLGWKQKLAFATALLHQPKLVFLDEPTSGVDPIVRREFWRQIYATASTGVTIFVTTHYMDEAEYCGRLSIMAQGQIKVMGTPEDIKKQMGVSSIEEVFGHLVRS
ncbi:MAG: ABC transporter ATP-binding protein [Bacteroidales bacterium]|jgi:ABC-2 type transport system ATP-binding protein|nr:ABC transporter ATP-binding protein [Bacteroidales bacterium]